MTVGLALGVGMSAAESCGVEVGSYPTGSVSQMDILIEAELKRLEEEIAVLIEELAPVLRDPEEDKNIVDLDLTTKSPLAKLMAEKAWRISVFADRVRRVRGRLDLAGFTKNGFDAAPADASVPVRSAGYSEP